MMKLTLDDARARPCACCWSRRRTYRPSSGNLRPREPA